MSKCKHYDIYTSVDETEHGICLGTKNKDYCYCDGDELACTFYPEKRKEFTKKKNTAEMWIDAQKDGKYYKTVVGNLIYQKNIGLVDGANRHKILLEMWDRNDKNINAFMTEKWEEIISKVDLCILKWDQPCIECSSWNEAPITFDYCPRCGRPLTKKGWEQLDENIKKYRINE